MRVWVYPEKQYEELGARRLEVEVAKVKASALKRIEANPDEFDEWWEQFGIPLTQDSRLFVIDIARAAWAVSRHRAKLTADRVSCSRCGQIHLCEVTAESPRPEEDLYDRVNALKLRLQFEIRHGEAPGIGDYSYLSNDSLEIIETALVAEVKALTESLQQLRTQLATLQVYEDPKDGCPMLTREEVLGACDDMLKGMGE